MKKRVLGISAAILLAVVGTVLLVGYVRNAESRALEGEEIVNVLVVDEDILQGTSAENIESRVRLEQVPQKVAVLGAIDSVEDIEGLVASRDMLPGEQLSRELFVIPTALSAYARSISAPPGFLEMTIALEPERVVGGSITPGDTVAVVASFEPFELSGVILPENFDTSLTKEELDELEKIYVVDDRLLAGDTVGTTTHILVHKILVTNVQEESQPQQINTSNNEDGSSAAAVRLAPTGKLLVTLALEAPTVERLVFTQEFGSIWLAAEPDNASEEGTRIVSRGNVFEDEDGFR
jgi:pilus assembly protein CpaB